MRSRVPKRVIEYVGGHAICGAKLRNKDAHCRQFAMANGRCKLHGGRTPAGIESPQWKHGRYSTKIPTRMLSRFLDAEGDETLLSNRQEISLITTRIEDLLGRVDTGEAGDQWKRLGETYRDFRRAMSAQDTAEMAIHLDELGKVINRGRSDYAAWHEIQVLIEQRRKLNDSESKRIQLAKQSVSVEELMAFIGSLGVLLKQNVTDPIALGKLSNGIAKLLGPAAPNSQPG